MHSFFAETVSDLVVAVVPRAAATEVRVVVAAGAPAQHLAQRAGGADLLVVGSRSRREPAGMVLGPVALHSVVHAPYPVMVVHPEPATATGAASLTAAVAGA